MAQKGLPNSKCVLIHEEVQISTYVQKFIKAGVCINKKATGNVKSLCSFLYELSNVTKLEFPIEKKSVARKKKFKKSEIPPKNKQNDILEK